VPSKCHGKAQLAEPAGRHGGSLTLAAVPDFGCRMPLAALLWLFITFPSFLQLLAYMDIPNLPNEERRLPGDFQGSFSIFCGS